MCSGDSTASSSGGVRKLCAGEALWGGNMGSVSWRVRRDTLHLRSRAKETAWGKDVGSWMGVEYLWIWLTMWYYSLPFVLLWGVSLHISHVRRQRLRQMKRFPQEHVVNKLSPGLFSIFYCLSHLPCCPAWFWSFYQFLYFFITVMEFGTVPHCVTETMGCVSSSRSSFFLQGITFICICKPCAAKALNISIAWHTHTHFHTLNSRGLEMFVYFCQHLTMIIFNHSHTCLSLKIVLTLPGRLFLVNTALPEPCVFHLPSSGSRDSRDWLWLISLLPCVDTPEFFLRVHRPLLARGLDFTSRAHLLTQVTESVALPAMSISPSSFLSLPLPTGHATLQGSTSPEESHLQAQLCLTCGWTQPIFEMEYTFPLFLSMDIKNVCPCFGILS